MNMKINVLCGLLAIGAVVDAHADILLDTGTPDNSGFPLVLDGSDFVATEFHLAGSYTIDGVSGYLTSGNVGDTFTIALYSDNNGHVGTQLQSTQAMFSADGWNGVSSLSWNTGAGNYWVAFEIGANDNLSSFQLPLSAPNHALATAFNADFRYVNASGMDYGVLVTGTPAVPVPAAAWLFASALGCFGGIAQRARRK